MTRSWQVVVEARARGGFDVVIRINAGSSRDVAAEMARVIRHQEQVDLRDLDGQR